MVSRNIKLLKIQNFFRGISPLAILVVVYFETVTHSYATALAVLSVSALVRGLFDIPTGIFSDKIGRKKILILSGVISFTSHLCMALAGTFVYVPLLFVGAFLFGVGRSLISGTDEALMYETMEDLGKSHEFYKLYSKRKGWYHLALLLSAGISSFVVFYFDASPLSLLILAWMAVFPVLGEIITFALCVEPKTRCEKTNVHSSFKHFKDAFILILANKRIRIFAILKVFTKSSDFCIEKIAPVYYASLIPLYLVSIVGVIKDLAMTASYFIVSYLKKLGFEKLLFVSEYLIAAIKLGAIAISNFLTPFIIAMSSIFFGISEMSQTTLLQNEFSKEQRATMASIISSLSSFGRAILFYISGVIADAYSFKIAVLSIVLMRLFIIIYTNFKFRKLRL